MKHTSTSRLCARTKVETLWLPIRLPFSGSFSAHYGSTGCPQWSNGTRATVPRWTATSLAIWEQERMCPANNSCLPPIDAGKVCSIACLNAGGLMHNRTHIRKRKLAALLKLAKKHSMTVVCERHGSFADVCRVLVAFNHVFDSC